MQNLAVQISSLPPATASGRWQRHVSAAHARHALDGRADYGRWGTRGGYPVLYLAQPRDSVVVEAYRHLIDPIEFGDDAAREDFLDNLLARVMVTCEVKVTNLLDLRTTLGRAQANLTPQDLSSATHDTEAYARCQRVAQVAHQLRMHGVIAPGATGLGTTLALFMDHLPAAERPERIPPDEPWHRLPSDPRISSTRPFRLIQGNNESP